MGKNIRMSGSLFLILLAGIAILLLLPDSLLNSKVLAVNGGIFAAPSGPYRTGGFYTATGDFDQDGILDLAGVLPGLDVASVLPGDGFGGFGPESTAPVGDQPFAAAAGDFNGDGFLDLTVSQRLDLSVLLGNGDGTFQPETRYDIGADIARFPAVGDFNSDGDADIAVAIRNPYVVSILIGNGDGTFQPAVQYPSGRGRNHGIAIGDFNEDGHQDLALGTDGDIGVSILLGIGDGSFGIPEVYAARGTPILVAIGDFNLDGHQDLAATDLFSSGPQAISVLLGAGDGTFGTFETFPAGTYPWGLTVGDFNLDGREDLATANLGTTDSSVLLGVGTGNFIADVPVALPSGLEHVLSEDVNGDGFEDLVFSPGAVVVLNQAVPPGTCNDLDGDGFGSPGDPSCPGGGATDCDDLNAALSPGAVEICDGIDNDCDTGVDEGFNADGDGFTTCAGDCDDTNRDVYPGAAEVCNFLDDDCDGVIDEDPEAAASCDDSFPCSIDSCDAALGCVSDTTSCTGAALASTLFPDPVLHVGDEPHSIASGDFNGDDNPDLVVANYGAASHATLMGDLSVLLGNGDGSFATEIRVRSGEAPFSVAVADFDSDGIEDLVAVNARSDDLSIFLGNGDGTFSDHTRFPAGPPPGRVVTADFDLDGHVDVAVSNSTTWTVSVLPGHGDGTLGPASSFNVGADPSGLTVGDFNGDGKPDLAVLNYGPDDVSILLGRGDGTFDPELRFGVGSSPRDLAVGDFNSDGNPDLAVVNYGSDDVSILPGRGDGSFDPETRFATADSPRAITVADFNDDGHEDLAVASRLRDVVSVLLGDGAGGFAPETRFPTGSEPVSVISPDLNSDGHPDLATADSLSGTVTVLLGAGDGTFPIGRKQFEAGIWTGSVAIGDFNSDGIPDLAAGNRGDDYINGTPSDVSILLGLGAGNFGPPARFDVGVKPNSVTVGDFNADGRQDLAIANNGSYYDGITGDVSILLGNGDGTFGPDFRLQAGANPFFVTVGDLNADGRQDLVVTNEEWPGSISVFLGEGDGTFQPETRYPDYVNPYSAVLGDFNGDRKQDVAVANRGYITVFIGNGDGTLQPCTFLLTGHDARSIQLGDFDGDGHQDLATANSDDVSIVPGNGDGTFDPPANYGSNSYGQGIEVGDFNLDGILDLAAIFANTNHLSVFPGNGDGTLSGQADFAAGNHPSGLDVGDFDSDGRQDVVTANQLSNSVTISLNQGPFSGCLDGDGDGYGFPGNPACAGGPAPDCDDTNPEVHPGAVEVCDLLDNDCDLMIDEGFDADGDRYTTCNGDCDDGDENNWSSCATCLDTDLDTYYTGCDAYISILGPDCDDTNPEVHPGAVEVCDLLDNDCDGVVDLGISAVCDFQPSTLNLKSEGNDVSLHATFLDLCTGEDVDPSMLSPVYLSRVYSAATGSIKLPTPRAEPGCDDATEDGIWENIASRNITGAGSATIRFNLPSDGLCETMDGDRQDIIAVLLDVPDGHEAQVCVSGTFPGLPEPVECCGWTVIANQGNR